MCGIAGFVAKRGNSLPTSIIIKMTDIIRHRGPDDEGYIVLNNEKEILRTGGVSTPSGVWETRTDYYPISDITKSHDILAKLAFGHRRLSILDLSPAGHQPMSYKDGRYWIIHNGEIYNYLDIKSELEKSGHIFKTKTDTEVILAAYSAWGEECLKRFVGMWAFAIYDRYSNEIFLARDRYGIKPLYYYFTPEGNLYFGSEIKQFTVLTGWKSKMNPQRVYDQLVYSFTDHTDETMFEGVFQLPGGCYFKSGLNSIDHNPEGRLPFRKWYVLNYHPFKGSFIDAANIFRTLFQSAVKEHLQADVPIGTALSGGLDSSSIVCEMNRILKGSGDTILQQTISSCSTDKRFCEKKWMDIVINHASVNAFFIYPKLDDVISMTPDILWHHDEPYQSQSAFLAYNLFKLAQSKNIKVLLNGQGADEYLGGYGQFAFARHASLARRFKIKSLLLDIKDLQQRDSISNLTVVSGILSHLLPPLFRRTVSNIISSSDPIRGIIDNDRLGVMSANPFDTIPVGYKTVPEISEHLTFYSTLPKYLHWEDRNAMAHSIEARVPFLDHRLVEFTYSLPDDFLAKGGVTKRVMREAMKGLLPKEIVARKDKMGFATPEEMWVKRDNPELFRNKVSEAIGISGGIIKPNALKYFDDIVKGKIPFDYTYWRLIMFSEWVQKFQVRI